MGTAKTDGKPAPRASKTTKPAPQKKKTPARSAAKKTTATKPTKDAAVSTLAEKTLHDVTDSVQADSTKLASRMVPITEIVMPESQPRRYFDPDSMESLVASVKREGILQPILLRPRGDKYELVAGERRYKAAKIALMTEIPAMIREMSSEQAFEYALAENLQREDLNPVEETEAILDLLALKLKTNWEGVTSLLHKLSRAERKSAKNADNNVRNSDYVIVESVFSAIGKISSEAFRVHRLPLLNLPSDILEALRAGKLEYTKAKEIAKLKSDEDRKQLLSEAIEFSLSFAEIHKRVLESKPSNEITQLQSRLDTAYKQVKKSKVWENPHKKSKLESLLSQLEALIASL